MSDQKNQVKAPEKRHRIRSVATGLYWNGWGWASSSQAETYGESELQAAITEAQAHGSVITTELVVIKATRSETAESAPIVAINPT